MTVRECRMSQTQADAAVAVLQIRTQTTHSVSFIVFRMTATLSHTLTSACTFRDSCCVEERDKKDTVYEVAGCTKTVMTQSAG